MTAGWLAQRITSVPGSSNYFLGGFITYSKKMKSELLGVSDEILEQHGAVSKETAEAMAIGARRRTGSTFSLAITGEAGPDPSENVPVGTVYVGLADASGTMVIHRQFFGDRTRIRVFATQMALDMLRKKCGMVGV
jgi:nicotinamide-nucleotide amidase